MMLRCTFALLALALFTLSANAAGAGELIMFDRKGCPWCAKWHAEIGVQGYAQTREGTEAPLRVHMLGKPMPADIKKLMPIVGTPTFVLVHNGKEIDRFEGYPGKQIFFGRLQLAIDKLSGADKRYKTIIVQ